jgi:outer membrane protein OmpA-like peptidoglycan-associated protein
MHRIALLLLASLVLASPAWSQTRGGVPTPGQTTADWAKTLNEKGSVTVQDIVFDAGTATIAPGSHAALATIGELLKSDPALRLDIQTHTDNGGQKAANLALSQARATAVRDYLVATFGIAADRLTATGFGDTDPIADNSSAEGRARNQRVEFVKVATKNAAKASPASGAGEWTGVVSAGLMAVGGETTGIVLTGGAERFELQAADPAMRRRLQALDGKTVIVRGTLETRPGVEVKTRRIITVAAVDAR